MKILVDCQPIQGLTRKGGIGRYTHCLLNALALNNDVQLLLLINKALPEPKNINLLQENATCIYWHPLTPSRYQYLEEQWAYHCNELIRQAVITINAPNVVLICSHFDGFGESNISPTFYPCDTPHLILIHDLIHLLNPQHYLQSAPLKAFYLQKIAFLQQAHSIFTISEATRADVLTYLKVDSKKVFNIGTGAPQLTVTVSVTPTTHSNPN